MQVLKDEMRKRIYEAATKEFAAKGFSKASMRNIAADAGMTVGNLYRYFKDKEALFYSIIGPAYESLMELVNVSIELADQNFDTSFFEYLSKQIIKICGEHKTELLILFEGSGGTRYENAKEEMIVVSEDFLKGKLKKKLEEKGTIIEDEYLFRVIAVGFVEGMNMIARNYTDFDKLQQVADQFISFYFKGVLDRFK
jgi:AcrR family transcriptional regulator